MDRFRRSQATKDQVHRLLNGSRWTHLADTARRDVRQGFQAVEEFIGHNPLIVLPVALVLGAVAGYWIKRK
jgi:hypothetical protein